MDMTPPGIWHLPIAHTHHLSASAGVLSFVGGAGDFDAAGRIRNPGNLDKQIEGAMANVAHALASESCKFDDVVRLKAHYTADRDDWEVIAALGRFFMADPMPVISTVPEPLQPFSGQTIQIQVIAQRGWRTHCDVRTVPRPVPPERRALFGDATVTAGLRAGEFIAVANRTAEDADGVLRHPEDGIAQSHFIMERHAETLAALGASFQDSVKMEGYYFGNTREQWAPLAKARASHFREPGPPATVVPCHRLNPNGALTKIEVMAMRELWNGFDKYIPREDHWPKRVWDWTIPLPYRQAIRLRDTIWLGGQVPLCPYSNKGQRVMAGQLLPQARFTMSYVEDLLRPFGRAVADLKLMVCYFTSTGTEAETVAFAKTLADCVSGALPPMTLVPKPMMHSPEATVEILGRGAGLRALGCAKGRISMRFIAAMMKHETNTFSPVPTPLSSFAVGEENDLPAAAARAVEKYADTNTAIAAYIELARREGAELVVPVAGAAAPSGLVADAAFEHFASAICGAVRKGCDALFLDLHGAMVTESHDDGERELLRRVRAIAPKLPIAVALDFHNNLSETMVQNATVIVGYRTYPHVDMRETGVRAGGTLLRAINGEIEPVIVWGRRPMLTHTLKQSPSVQPMKNIMDAAMAAEQNGRVLNASVFGGFPMADIPHVGLFAVIVADRGAAAAAERLRDNLLDEAWRLRADFVFQVEPLASSLNHAKTLEGRPIVLVDHGDNVFSGGTQDVMETVEEAFKAGLSDMAIGPIWDPQTVKELVEAGVGARVTVKLGGKIPMPALGFQGRPLEVSGTVRRITDGRYKITGPMMTGLTVNHGLSAVLDTGAAEILICSERWEPFDLRVFRHAGIEPTAKRYLLIKSRQHFRAGFEPIAKHIVLLSGPGVTSSDYSLFRFGRVPRPLYPLDTTAANPGGARLKPGRRAAAATKDGDAHLA
ncbi:M81 family metallopeptidase [Bradyrhizobium sp. SRL28]|uniref:M81 family metallopeptidase n=1 Tax=Bradyrhizobium sp. SRL28 TaxID=2836178 RepID=UPI001BDF0E33|nr:M81 family metallopeptidase [Bradyrhizobium sp. SRL28]MBT1517150.1 M81 family metallopeptidase [Bradyrhizobium sp. SRL28]